MTEKTTYIIEIDLKAPLKKTLAADLPKRLKQAAYDFIMARGGDCGDVKVRRVEELKQASTITWAPAFVIPDRPADIEVTES